MDGTCLCRYFICADEFLNKIMEYQMIKKDRMIDFLIGSIKYFINNIISKNDVVITKITPEYKKYFGHNDDVEILYDEKTGRVTFNKFIVAIYGETVIKSTDIDWKIQLRNLFIKIYDSGDFNNF